MVIVVIDTAPYTAMLAGYLEPGITLTVCDNLDEGFRTITKQTTDVVILDVLAPSADGNVDPQMGLKVCANILEQGVRTLVNLFTAIEKSELSTLLERKNIKSDRLTMFSKIEMDIPPALAPIDEQLIHNPYLLGIDMVQHLPRCVTASWIDTLRSPYPWLCAYVMNKAYLYEGTGEPSQSSPGLRMIFLLCRFESDVDNGGLQQWLANATDERGRDLFIDDTIVAAREIGVKGLAELMEEAKARWADLTLKYSKGFRSPSVVDDEIYVAREAFQREVDEQLGELAEAYQELGDDWIKVIDKYIKDNSAEFVDAVE